MRMLSPEVSYNLPLHFFPSPIVLQNSRY